MPTGINLGETTLFANINGKYERIGSLDIESELMLEPNGEVCIGDFDIDLMKDGATISFKPIRAREFFRIIFPFLANNNWRKLHGLPMWRK